MKHIHFNIKSAILAWISHSWWLPLAIPLLKALLPSCHLWQRAVHLSQQLLVPQQPWKKAVIEVEQILRFAGFSAILVTAVYTVWFPDSTRYCHHLSVMIGYPSEQFPINIHEWAARWASSRSIFKPCASQTASLSSLGFTMSNTTWQREVRIHRSTPRSAHVRL